MAETTYYDSPLTGEELDEAFRKLADLDASVSSAAASAAAANQSKVAAADSAAQAGQDADTAEKAAQTVAANAANIQAVVDNLAAIRAAPAAAQSAAASATAAQQAAQEALGFRTFFSVVTPDANGDLDPSRPMTTPSAQASWTIKSKGDRIASVEVDGFTQQAGSGDPSPDNVRDISAGGLRMIKVVLDGTTNKFISTYNPGNYPISNTTMFEVKTTASPIYGSASDLLCNIAYFLPRAWANDYPYTVGWYGSSGMQLGIRLPFTGSNALNQANQYLVEQYNAGNPVIVWYEPADESQATGLYIPIQAQGNEYRCQCLELTAPLCAGDKVESCVPSGCDKRVVLDGSIDESWSLSSSSVTGYIRAVYSIPEQNAVQDSAISDIYRNALYSEWSAVSASAGSFVSVTSFAIVVQVKTNLPNTIENFKTILQENPLTVWYRSTAYTEENDIPVQLETHVYNKMTFDGTEGFSYSPASKLIYINFPDAVANQNTTIVCSAYTGGGAGTGENKCAINSAKDFTLYGPYESLESGVSVVTSLASAGTPVTVVYKLAIPAIYAHDPVTIVAIPYTQADVDAANQLANTPSMLPNIDSPDVPMLLNSADNTDSAAQVMALAANAVPVAGTYVVSSQDGTTLAVSLKAMQDGGDAATLGGLTLDDVKQLISDAVTAAVALAQGGTN